jgi:hypothetical protein
MLVLLSGLVLIAQFGAPAGINIRDVVRRTRVWRTRPDCRIEAGIAAFCWQAVLFCGGLAAA